MFGKTTGKKALEKGSSSSVGNAAEIAPEGPLLTRQLQVTA
jgi:hypothetical protein